MIHGIMVTVALVAALGGGGVASIVTKRRELRATDPIGKCVVQAAARFDPPGTPFVVCCGAIRG